ncbi:MAG: CorA family divalent cation transporter [Lachnotalea sp.]
MFYILNEKEPLKVELKDISNDKISVGYLTMEELETNLDTLGIKGNILQDCMNDQTHFRTSIDTYDSFSFGIINIVNVMNVHEPKDRVAFIIRKNQFILVKLVDEDDSYRDMFESSIGRFTQNVTLGKVIFGILESLLWDGNKSLEITEQKIMKMEQDLVNGEINQNLNKEIFKLRKNLAILKNYYEQLIDIGEELQENENELFEEEDIKYFRIFTVKSERLSNNTQALSENLIHLREALDASLNYSLNKTMKLFTVVTTIFLPLTLIVGWYGMNFTNMPELTWKYGYLSVILLSLFVIGVCLNIFRKKKFF